jgi:anti-sigma regulatory factor (Ser/Thr protein kinase)
MHVGLLLLIMHVYMFNFEYNNETNNLLNTKVIMKPWFRDINLLAIAYIYIY